MSVQMSKMHPQSVDAARAYLLLDQFIEYMCETHAEFARLRDPNSKVLKLMISRRRITPKDFRVANGVVLSIKNIAVSDDGVIIHTPKQR